MHLARLALLDGGDDEAGAAEDDLPPGPAVHRELELPLAHVVRPRQLHALRTLNALGLTWRSHKHTGRRGGHDTPAQLKACCWGLGVKVSFIFLALDSTRRH